VLQEYKSATNMTEQFAALAAIAQNPGKTRDDVLADFYGKWQHDFLVNISNLYDELLCFCCWSRFLLSLSITPMYFINLNVLFDGDAGLNLRC